jgi:hypothetical protein
MAEGAGFELAVAEATSVFKTDAIVHSANLPKMVESMGVAPTTFAMPLRRSAS